MASIRKEFVVSAPPAKVWDAVRDFGAVHQRLAPGFLIDAKRDGDVREVTFFNGNTAREALIDCDDAAMRLVYSVIGERFTHDNASVQIVPDGAGSRFIWQRDMLPHELKPAIDGMMDRACGVMKATLDAL